MRRIVSLVAISSTLCGMPALAEAQEAGPEKKVFCDSDDATRTVHDDLRGRGFPEEIVSRACDDVARWSAGERRDIEGAAILASLGFSDRSRRRFLRSEHALGDYLLHARRENRRLMVGGAFLTVAGFGLAVAGGVILGFHRSWYEIYVGESALFLTAGGGALIAGVAMLGVAGSREGRFVAPEELWDRRDPGAVERWHRESYSPANEREREKEPKIQVSPLLGRGRGGLALRWVF